MVQLKQYNTQSRISPEKLEQCSSNLAPEMYITKETEWHICSQGNSLGSSLFLWKTKYPHLQPFKVSMYWLIKNNNFVLYTSKVTDWKDKVHIIILLFAYSIIIVQRDFCFNAKIFKETKTFTPVDSQLAVYGQLMVVHFVPFMMSSI